VRAAHRRRAPGRAPHLPLLPRRRPEDASRGAVGDGGVRAQFANRVLAPAVLRALTRAHVRLLAAASIRCSARRGAL